MTKAKQRQTDRQTDGQTHRQYEHALSFLFLKAFPACFHEDCKLAFPNKKIEF